MNGTKKLVILSGVTGAIGSQFLDHYARQENTVVYGLSRKGSLYKNFLTKEGFLPVSTIIFSADLDTFAFVKEINPEDFSEVLYVHALGLFPFEINRKGEHVVENDHDGDGINDECERLTYKVFAHAMSTLRKHLDETIPVTAIVFGSLADIHRPLVHYSWWKTMEKMKGWAKKFTDQHAHVKIVCVNISSVLCPHEVITRPFVFIKTDADPSRWLSPYELVQFLSQRIHALPFGFSEVEHYLAKDSFTAGYYIDKKFTPRKMNELF